jgi:hypothetical protein
VALLLLLLASACGRIRGCSHDGPPLLILLTGQSARLSRSRRRGRHDRATTTCSFPRKNAANAASASRPAAAKSGAA